MIYQVYMRSYADSDGDGNGDIAGLRARLGHIRDLGVDAIWINPWYRSPMVDNGYDVSDYRDIDPMFGDMEQAIALVQEAHQMGLRVILDMVANHTSDQHPWFQAALASPHGSPERARYHFRDGRGPGGDLPPNDWISAFGGIAWTRSMDPDGSPGQWYLHLFAPQQPDLNWENPQVLAEFESVLRFWYDRDVDGLRIDAASAFAKAADLPNSGLPGDAQFLPAGWVDIPFWDVDSVHEIHRLFRRIADSYEDPRMLVGEVVTNGPERLALYLRPDELHCAFNLEMVRQPWRAEDFRRVVDATLAALAPVGAPASWVLSSHDETRHLTRFAPVVDGEVDLVVGARRARAAVMLVMALPGSAYIYQGEELGLPEVWVPDEAILDPVFERSGGAQRGRDGARVPLPWRGEEPPYGFSETRQTWLPQPTGWAELTVAHELGRPGSMLEHYRSALRLRRELFKDSSLSWRDAPDGVLFLDRGPGVSAVVNFSERPFPIAGEVLLSSEPLVDGQLPPDAAAWLATTV